MHRSCQGTLGLRHVIESRCSYYAATHELRTTSAKRGGSLFYKSLDAAAVQSHIEAVEDQDSARGDIAGECAFEWRCFALASSCKACLSTVSGRLSIPTTKRAEPLMHPEL